MLNQKNLPYNFKLSNVINQHCGNEQAGLSFGGIFLALFWGVFLFPSASFPTIHLCYSHPDLIKGFEVAVISLFSSLAWKDEIRWRLVNWERAWYGLRGVLLSSHHSLIRVFSAAFSLLKHLLVQFRMSGITTSNYLIIYSVNYLDMKNHFFRFHCHWYFLHLTIDLLILTLKVLVATIDALGHFETG